MRDPTITEMREALAPLAAWLDASDFDVEGAIYWFANDYHSGQWSNLYSALSTSGFHPGPVCRGPESESVEALLYAELEGLFQ